MVQTCTAIDDILLSQKKFKAKCGVTGDVKYVAAQTLLCKSVLKDDKKGAN